MEQTIIDLGTQIATLTAEIEAWKFWLTLIVGIVAFIVAIGCAIIPVYARSGVKKGTIDGTKQALEELNKQHTILQEISELKKQTEQMDNKLKDLEKMIEMSRFVFPLTLCNGARGFLQLSKDMNGTVSLSGNLTLSTLEEGISILPEGFKPNKKLSIPIFANDGKSHISGTLTIVTEGSIYASAEKDNSYFDIFVSFRTT